MHVRIRVKVLRVRIALMSVFLKHTIVFVQILSIRLSMLVRVGQGLGEEVLAEYNGQKFINTMTLWMSSWERVLVY
jgi:hypothetical protein